MSRSLNSGHNLIILPILRRNWYWVTSKADETMCLVDIHPTPEESILPQICNFEVYSIGNSSFNHDSFKHHNKANSSSTFVGIPPPKLVLRPSAPPTSTNEKSYCRRISRDKHRSILLLCRCEYLMDWHRWNRYQENVWWSSRFFQGRFGMSPD